MVGASGRFSIRRCSAVVDFGTKRLKVQRVTSLSLHGFRGPRPHCFASFSHNTDFSPEVVVISSSEDEEDSATYQLPPHTLRIEDLDCIQCAETAINITSPEGSTTCDLCYVELPANHDLKSIHRPEVLVPRKESNRKRRRLERYSKYGRRRTSEPLISWTVSPSAGEERYKKVPTLNYGVEVRDSTIPEAGRGLFASRDFKKGEFVTEYVGEIITRDEARRRLRRGQFHYLGTLVTGMYEIDGIQVPRDGEGAASFINHARKPHANVQWAHVEDRKACFRRMFAKASRDIAAGEELFLDYGKTYWEHHRRWKIALEKGREMLSDETLTSSEEEDFDSEELILLDDDTDETNAAEKLRDYSPKVEISTEDETASFGSLDLSVFAKEFHLRPREPPSKVVLRGAVSSV
eukprot:Gregarina_sp_Poly_1__5014@NODE_2659_length_1862_cov_546_523120_g1686_i0_p1_GENE_NODE_2659_length_1862_cov_546_523120_g1686_i0NODE_2659_length_1862_cov_546_523120_g1686_i0_p1_ORF_typecomplete_len407_score48_26SET/PF00856_28/1_6e17_NODE_2659_length_1862_cov_546_523120_g1686_i05721792